MDFVAWFKSAAAYVRDRFTKKEVSTWIGVALTIASGGGYLTVEQVTALQALAHICGLDVDTTSTLLSNLSGVLGAFGIGSILHKPGGIAPKKLNIWAVMCLSVAVWAFGLQINQAFAADATNQITCSVPTSRADGSHFAPTEIDHYTLYRSACGNDSLEKVKDFGPDCATTDAVTMEAAICSLQYAITVTDGSGLESDKSAAVQVTNVLSPPAPPGNVTVVTHSGN